MSRGEQKLSPFEKSIAYGKELADDLKHWNSYLDGTKISFDPFYEDGCNMNCIRRQIMSIRKRIEKELPKELYPKEYFLPIPDEVDNHFIAFQDTLVEKGEKRLEEIKQMPSYIQLISLQYPDIITPKEDDKNHVYYYAVVGYVKNLERSIREAKAINTSYLYCHNPFLDLRRYASYENSWWIEAFTRCINSIYTQFPTIFKRSSNSDEEIYSEISESDCIPEIQAAIKTPKMQKAESIQKANYMQYSLFDFGLI